MFHTFLLPQTADDYKAFKKNSKDHECKSYAAKRWSFWDHRVKFSQRAENIHNLSKQMGWQPNKGFAHQFLQDNLQEISAHLSHVVLTQPEIANKASQELSAPNVVRHTKSSVKLPRLR